MKYLLSLILLCSSLLASEIQLKQQLNIATPGSFVVTEQGKTYALLYVRERDADHITIEEVAIPASNFTRQKISWRTWFESGAPGHTLWTVSQINLDTGAIEKTFSYTHQGWVDMSDSNSLLAQLLNLTFTEVPTEERKRVGLPPGVNRKDNRPIWNPRVIVDGSPLANVPFSVYRTRWPRDRTDLSCKPIDIYIPHAIDGRDYPIFFPYLVEVEGKVGSAKLRVVDSGQEAHSPKLPLPTPQPSITDDNPLWTDEGLVFNLVCNIPPSSDYMVILEDDACILPLPTTMEEGRVLVKREDLPQDLTPDAHFTLYIA